MELTAQRKTSLLREMLRIRRIEEAIAGVYPAGVIQTPTHLSIGEEAVAVGVCCGLDCTDQIFSSHRCHAHYLAKGGDLKRFLAELYGRETGCCRGRGGSVHLVDRAAGMMGSSAILGGSAALAVGAAFAFAYDRAPHLAVVFHGDAVMEEGAIWECFNIAVLHKLPILFVCENNLYSTSTPYAKRQVPIPIHERAAAMGLEARQVDGNDVCAVAQCAEAMLARARQGRPQFLEAMTYRIREHVGPLFDFEQGIRPEAEVRAWMEKCPIKRLRAELLAEGGLSDNEYERMEVQLRAEIDEAIRFAEQSPWPDPAHILDHTY